MLEVSAARAFPSSTVGLIHRWIRLHPSPEQRGLVDLEKVPSDKGPPRKVYSLNAQGQAYLEEFWRTWSFLAERLEQLHKGGS